MFNFTKIRSAVSDPERVRSFLQDYLDLRCWESRNADRRRFGASVSLPFHKGIEIELERSRRPWAKWYIQNKLTTNHDHAGFFLDLSLLGYSCDFRFYDDRHWNYTESRWYKAGEEERQIEADKRVIEELEEFLSDPANNPVLARKMRDYIRFLGISGRADFHEHLFDPDDERISN